MATHFQVRSADPDAMQWARDQGLDPRTLRRDVVIHDDGSVELQRFLTDDDGRSRPAPSEDGMLSEPVVVDHPTRPFPGVT